MSGYPASKYPTGTVVVDMQVIPFFSANLMQLASKFRRRLILKVASLILLLLSFLLLYFLPSHV